MKRTRTNQKPSADRRNQPVRVWVTAQQKKTLTALAGAQGISVSAYIVGQLDPVLTADTTPDVDPDQADLFEGDK